MGVGFLLILHTLSDVTLRLLFSFITFIIALSHNWIKEHCRFSRKFTIASKLSIPLWKECFCKVILPILWALCLMLLPSYYAQYYAGIIGSSLLLTHAWKSYKKWLTCCKCLSVFAWYNYCNITAVFIILSLQQWIPRYHSLSIAPITFYQFLLFSFAIYLEPHNIAS